MDSSETDKSPTIPVMVQGWTPPVTTPKDQPAGPTRRSGSSRLLEPVVRRPAQSGGGFKALLLAVFFALVIGGAATYLAREHLLFVGSNQQVFDAVPC